MVGVIYNFLDTKKIMIFNKGIYLNTYSLLEYDMNKLNHIYTLNDVSNITFGRLDGKNIEENYKKAIIQIVKMKNIAN